MAPKDEEREFSIHTGEIPLFGSVDYAMFVITLLISCGIGLFYAIVDRKKNTTKDFLLGGQNMHPVPVALSLMVTFMSAMTLLGNPAEIYNYHTMWWWLCVSMVIAMWMVSQIFVPFFYRLQNESVFEVSPCELS
ncbi:sodium-coupled monocarboxylate transporter 2 [Plakobranchus ocellatus]|uniref:Sodium-coupled monocarboxylate transporter 2 n=1 Tax=Plakobranchus ocellatus TaxID=259542 RepID=A0AAV3YUR5_9GAST|nr:sodium-coupled monocarboxylate transporter 2 [Plakobranchus ocellatus]